MASHILSVFASLFKKQVTENSRQQNLYKLASEIDIDLKLRYGIKLVFVDTLND